MGAECPSLECPSPLIGGLAVGAPRLVFSTCEDLFITRAKASMIHDEMLSCEKRR